MPAFRCFIIAIIAAITPPRHMMPATVRLEKTELRLFASFARPAYRRYAFAR